MAAASHLRAVSDEPVSATRSRTREALVAAAARAYEAAHGNALPEPVGRLRWRISPRVLTSAGLVLALLVGVGVLQARPQPSIVPVAAMSESPLAGVIVVHVAGQVASPGVYELASGARLADAIEAAGGALETARLDAVNLARLVADGEQVLVPAQGEGGGGVAADGRINLNTANASELESLPGIGPVLAERIVADRERSGPYGSVNDLARVSGIGPSILAALAEEATV